MLPTSKYIVTSSSEVQESDNLENQTTQEHETQTDLTDIVKAAWTGEYD